MPNTFEGSFWMVSKVSKEEMFMKNGVDLLIKTAAQDSEKVWHFNTWSFS